MESQPQNSEFMINPENFHPCMCGYSFEASQSARHFRGRVLWYM